MNQVIPFVAGKNADTITLSDSNGFSITLDKRGASVFEDMKVRELMGNAMNDPRYQNGSFLEILSFDIVEFMLRTRFNISKEIDANDLFKVDGQFISKELFTKLKDFFIAELDLTETFKLLETTVKAAIQKQIADNNLDEQTLVDLSPIPEETTHETTSSKHKKSRS